MEYLIHLAIVISIYSILGLSLNLIVGYTGLLSMTQAAFYGIGAYATAIAMTSYGMNFFLAVVIGILLSALSALAIGYVLSRFDGDYFTLGSFGFNVIITAILVNWRGFTGGATGIPAIARPSLFGFTFSGNLSFLVLVLVSAVIIYFICQFIVRSSFGRVLKAIREDEKAIQVFGYNTKYYKLAIFAIGAMMASVAGAFYASYLSYISPAQFDINESAFILSIVVFGGLANNKGAIWGAAFLILLPEALQFVGFPSGIAEQLRQVVYGLALVFLMLYRPQGLVGEYKI